MESRSLSSFNINCFFFWNLAICKINNDVICFCNSIIIIKERKKINDKELNNPRDIIAKKDAMITDIYNIKGETVISKYQYVKKGDLLKELYNSKGGNILNCWINDESEDFNFSFAFL